MAESVREGTLSNNLPIIGNVTNLDCAICLQNCIHPAELPCGHIFCYLCIKGIVNQGSRCAMCRQDIPVDYLDNPILLKPIDAEFIREDGLLWFYEGHNGWWQYDERTTKELESAYQRRETCCELLIAGLLYVIDFDGMLQYRRSDPSKRRRIKRDLATAAKLGIAGLKAKKTGNTSNVSERAPHERIQRLPVTSLPLLNTSEGVSNSNQNNSDQQAEPVRISPTPRQNLTRYTANNRQTSNTTESSSPLEETSTNLNLNNAIQNTLDWTIEQIESLNLELLNDYEALFRDVSNYEQLESNLNQNRHNRTSNNYMSRYLNLSNPLHDSFDSDSETANTDFLLSNLSISEPNETPPDSITETSPSNTDGDTNTSSEPLVSTSPVPPVRSRRISSLRPRRGIPSSSSTGNLDSLSQKFISKK